MVVIVSLPTEYQLIGKIIFFLRNKKRHRAIAQINKCCMSTVRASDAIDGGCAQDQRCWRRPIVEAAFRFC